MANASKEIVFYLAEVVDTHDDNGAGRIRAFIPTIDGDIKMKNDKPLRISDVPYAFPLLPKHLHVVPRIGEAVLVTTQKLGDMATRFYIGPLISQPYHMDWESPFKHVTNVLPGPGGEEYAIQQSPVMDPENEGTLPDDRDIAIEGRGNTDIVLKENEMRLRCGYKENPGTKVSKDRLHRNKTDQGYIQLRFNKSGRNSNKKYASAVNVVGDRINLLSHDSPDYFDLNDPKELISEATMEKILKEAHPLVYGDILIEYLKKLIAVFRTHTHPFAMDPPCLNDAQVAAIDESQLDEMLSKSVRTN